MKRKGFTLVELLVVISIIALLMAILMPVLSKVKAIANQMVCGTNLSGIGKSMMLYAGDMEDDYPIAGGKRAIWTTRNTLGSPQWYDEEEETAYSQTSPGIGGQVTVTSALYLLVKYADMTPSQFICSGDVLTGEFKLSDFPEAQAYDQDIELEDIWDFGPQPGLYCSYSYHMPYIATMSPGGTSGQAYPLSPAGDPASPVAADRNLYADINARDYRPPALSGRTEEAPDVTSDNHYVDPDKTGSSACHQRNGQNVLFNDTHVDFKRFPNVGINNDNIYKYWERRSGGRMPTLEELQIGGEPSGNQGILPGSAAPQDYKDAVLVHERNQYN